MVQTSEHSSYEKRERADLCEESWQACIGHLREDGLVRQDRPQPHECSVQYIYTYNRL